MNKIINNNYRGGNNLKLIFSRIFITSKKKKIKLNNNNSYLTIIRRINLGQTNFLLRNVFNVIG